MMIYMMVAADADGGGSLIAADVMMTSSGGSQTVNNTVSLAYAYCTFLLCDEYTCKNYLKRILWQGRNKILRGEKEVRATSMTLLVHQTTNMWFAVVNGTVMVTLLLLFLERIMCETTYF